MIRLVIEVTGQKRERERRGERCREIKDTQTWGEKTQSAKEGKGWLPKEKKNYEKGERENEQLSERVAAPQLLCTQLMMPLPPLLMIIMIVQSTVRPRQLLQLLQLGKREKERCLSFLYIFIESSQRSRETTTATATVCFLRQKAKKFGSTRPARRQQQQTQIHTR